MLLLGLNFIFVIIVSVIVRFFGLWVIVLIVFCVKLMGIILVWEIRFFVGWKLNNEFVLVGFFSEFIVLVFVLKMVKLEVIVVLVFLLFFFGVWVLLYGLMVWLFRDEMVKFLRVILWRFVLLRMIVLVFFRVVMVGVFFNGLLLVRLR